MAGKKKDSKKKERVGGLEAYRRRVKQRRKTTLNPTAENIDAYNTQPGGRKKAKKKKTSKKKKSRKR